MLLFLPVNSYRQALEEKNRKFFSEARIVTPSDVIVCAIEEAVLSLENISKRFIRSDNSSANLYLQLAERGDSDAMYGILLFATNLAKAFQLTFLKL